MSDWSIIRIKDDAAAKGSERWTIVYSVPVEYAPDGVFSFSIPKNSLNSVAAAFEYDIEDHDQADAMFDHLMTYPMLTAPVIGEPDAGGFGALMRSGSATARPLAGAKAAVDGTNLYARDPAELRESIMAGIGEMKAGLARLQPAEKVELHEAGRFVAMADTSENPKYLVMQDMMSRLLPGNIEKGREFHRSKRAALTGRR
ncbi:hypothetical protein ACIBQX_18700 [Nonomuraea sp. NPDC049714]|uniref:hypothetical protein n=1 Tax=Nonomuraea sp. NPDC049714 TaxID=3364357 RepID=UPI0037985022